ncbi:MAG TPA: ABC transporter ATP-binding protein [Candidatus Dormibacteraeota bacterium]
MSQLPRGARPPGWVRRLLPYLRPHRNAVVVSLAAAVLASGCQAAAPLVARQILDNVILHHRSPMAPWLAALVGIGALAFLFGHLRRYQGGRVALAVQYDLRNAMYDRLMGLDFASHDRMPTGQLVSRANSDSTLVQGLLALFPNVSGNALLLVSSLVIMVILSPPLAVVSLIVAPALLVVSYRMRSQIFPATWDGQQKEGEVAQIVDEDVNGVRIVKAFGQERRELLRLTAAAKRLYGSRLRAVRLQARYQPILQALPTLGQVAVLGLGGWLALHHEITLGTFLAFSTYLTSMMAPARTLAGMLTIAQQARAGLERIFDLLDSRPAIQDSGSAIELPGIRGEVQFQGVTFGYQAEATVLRGLELTVAPGETVALVGRSGSGKSTVAALIPRFYDVTEGAVLVDGHDVRELTLSSLRGQIGVAFEESFLFSTSIRANIAYGRPDASLDEIMAVARLTQADEFISRLPDGYDTVVGERGLSLSGGQRQRVALARALLTDPRILILDDATSAVDGQVEEAIHRGLRQLMTGRTTILVAHRQSTLGLADRIVVVDQGEVIDQGSHAQLMERCALYRELLSGPEKGASPLTVGLVDVKAAPDPGSAWRRPERNSGVATGAGGGHAMAPTLGAGLGGTGSGGWRHSLAPTPELLAKVAALRPVRDDVAIDVDAEAPPGEGFSLWGFVRDYRRPLGLGLALVILDAIASLAGPLLIQRGIDQGVVAGSLFVIIAASLVFLVITLLDLADSIAETFITGRTAERLMLALRVKIFAQLQRLSIDYYEREMAGRIMTRMTTDVDSLESLLESGLITAVVSVCTFVGVGVALFFINWRLAAASMFVIGPLGIATTMFRRRAGRIYDRARERIAIVNADFQESLAGVREAQAFRHERLSQAEFHRLGGRYLEARLSAQRLVSVYFPFVQFLADVADAVILGFGGYLIAQGQLTSGALIAFLLYIDMFFSPIQQLSQVFDSWQQAGASMRRIRELMGSRSLTPSPAHPIPARLPHGVVALEGVHFTYPVREGSSGRATSEGRSGSAEAALRGIDLTIPAGQTVALVGETGAGKSTLAKLVVRFYDPERGRVMVDGQDLRQLAPEDYRHHVGYVPQEPFLFTGSIRDNIAYGRPEASPAEVEAAARGVGADHFIERLSNGYEHQLLERGRSLSTGQRQLIALARAQLIDPKILVLDEATSNLDLATEARVAAAMTRLASGRTTIVIAHRLQTARSADRIVILARGRIVEDGAHEALLADHGPYASMWATFQPEAVS